MGETRNNSNEINLDSSLAYVLGPISGVYFLIVSKNKQVRFHAMQSIFLCVVWFIINLLLGLTIIFAPLVGLFSMMFFVVWLMAVYRNWKGDNWEIPIISDYAKKFVK